MSYSVKEIFYSLQGEGAQTGRPAVFCRFSGCNLWSGLEKDRPKSICRLCGTDFLGTDGPGGGVFDNPLDLAQAVREMLPKSPNRFAPYLVVCTGGEPLLQMDQPLIEAFHRLDLKIAVETNGTLLPPTGLDWVCVSPKNRTGLKLRYGDELKLIFPQEGLEPEIFEKLNFRYFFLQPLDGPEKKENTEKAIRYCLEHPHWRLSLQIHKILGLP
jgi:7-carboxy-7-deazaguanine synthase